MFGPPPSLLRIPAPAPYFHLLFLIFQIPLPPEGGGGRGEGNQNSPLPFKKKGEGGPNYETWFLSSKNTQRRLLQLEQAQWQVFMKIIKSSRNCETGV